MVGLLYITTTKPYIISRIMSSVIDIFFVPRSLWTRKLRDKKLIINHAVDDCQPLELLAKFKKECK
jgi:hypothetical protein